MSLHRLLKHPLLKSGMMYTLTDAVNKSIPFFLLPIIAHYLTPDAYGIVANFNVIVSITVIFICMGVDTAISVNFYKFDKYQLAEYISNAVLIVVVLFLFFLLLVGMFHAYLFDWIKISYVYLIATVIIAISQVFTTINLSLWRLENKPLAYGGYEITQTAINIGLSLFFIISLHQGWEGRVNGYFGAATLYGVFSLLFLIKRGYFKFKINKRFIKDILIVGLPIVPHTLSIWIRTGADRLIITKLIGEEATGIYATGFQFGVLLSFLTMAFHNAYVPFLYKKLSDPNLQSLTASKNKIVKFTYGYIAFLILITVLLVLVSRFLIHYILPANYTKAQGFVLWAFLSQLFQAMYLMFVCYIFFIKKTKGLPLITFTCACFQVALSYTFVQKYGAIGAAYSTVIISFLNFVAVAWYSTKVFKMPWFDFSLKV